MSPIEITLLFLLFATVMFVWEKIPLALTSVIVCLGLVLTGVLDAKSAFNGFINTNVILFVGMFIVGGALFETGMANRIGGLVTRFAKTERQLIVAIMVIVGALSGFLSNTGTAAVLIPVVIGIAAKSGFSRSRLLMPLVFAAAMGLLWLSTIPLTNGVIAGIFGMRYLSMLSGFVFFSHQIGSFLGVWLGGYLHTLEGNYNTVWIITIALGIFAGLVNLPIREGAIVREAPVAA